jgi:hypothetical protein
MSRKLSGPVTLRRALAGALVGIAVLAVVGVGGALGVGNMLAAKTAYPGNLVVNDLNHGVTANQLAQSIVGDGVTISNVTYTGAPNAAGSFTGGTGLTGFDAGIVLGSGSVQSQGTHPCEANNDGAAATKSRPAPRPHGRAVTDAKGVEGPNDCDGVTTDNGLPGDADLDTLSGKTTFDAAVLEFDFVPEATSLTFRYVFSSDEYNEYANTSFNDTFALLVNGVNCAVVPGTLDTAVGVNTINGGGPTYGQNPQHPDLFLNNDLDDGGPAYNTEMDGLTVPLQCTAAVTPGQTNHLKLAIADASDSVLDSNVFIGGGTVVASGHTLSGHIYENDNTHPLGGAFVEACQAPDDTVCRVTESTPDGAYHFFNLPDGHDWDLSANPPDGSDDTPGYAGPVHVDGADVGGQDIILEGPAPLPAGASVDSPDFGNQTSGVPTVHWEESWSVTIHGCAGGNGTATVHVNDDGYEQTVNLVEGPAGTYTATFDPVFPHHGDASVSATLSCGTTVGFDMYIDPSGVVKDTNGNPISGATVTLFRSDDPGGPFVQVPDGSAIMSPSNRNNPDTTDANGHFGWDVVAGYYKVRAQKNGCTSHTGSTDYAETAVLTIPPPVTDLELILNCSGDTTAPTVTVPADITAEATGAGGAVVDFASQVSASDPDDQAGPVNCQPASGSTFPLGQTTVTCSSTDTNGNTGSAQFNVTVQDTTAPNLTLPPTQNANATSPAGAAVTFSPAPSATDAVDGSVPVVCTPTSGSTFPNGDTVVHCHATDAHSNTANGQFTVHVRGPAEQSTNLKALLNSFADVASSIRKSLGKKLDTVVKDLNKGPKGTKAACSQVKSFTKTVTKDIPKKIPPAEGNQLLAGAGNIKSAIGCA